MHFCYFSNKKYIKKFRPYYNFSLAAIENRMQCHSFMGLIYVKITPR